MSCTVLHLRDTCSTQASSCTSPVCPWFVDLNAFCLLADVEAFHGVSDCAQSQAQNAITSSTSVVMLTPFLARFLMLEFNWVLLKGAGKVQEPSDFVLQLHQ